MKFFTTPIGYITVFIICFFFYQKNQFQKIQTQIDELRIIVNQKSLPAFILDEIRIR